MKDRFTCKYRGKIYAKNVGEIDMYFIEKEIKTAKAETAIVENESEKVATVTDKEAERVDLDTMFG